MAELQPELPGLSGAEPREDRPPARRLRHSHARVWSDPAVLTATARADARYEEWRAAFSAFLAAQPPERLAELRRRIADRRRPSAK